MLMNLWIWGVPFFGKPPGDIFQTENQWLDCRCQHVYKYVWLYIIYLIILYIYYIIILYIYIYIIFYIMGLWVGFPKTNKNKSQKQPGFGQPPWVFESYRKLRGYRFPWGTSDYISTCISMRPFPGDPVWGYSQVHKRWLGDTGSLWIVKWPPSNHTVPHREFEDYFPLGICDSEGLC